MTTSPVKYRNQPVRACSLETYFRGNLGLFSRFGPVQERFGAELPNLYVPRVQLDEPLALRPFQMRSATNSKSLALALNQATFISYDYPGGEKFLQEAVATLTTVLELLQITGLTKVVYRYDNELALVRDPELGLDVGRVLQLKFPVGSTDASKFHDITLKTSQPIEDGRISTEIAVEIKDGFELLSFSFAAEKTGGLASDLNRVARLAHRDASAAFHQLITKEYSDSLEKE